MEIIARPASGDAHVHCHALRVVANACADIGESCRRDDRRSLLMHSSDSNRDRVIASQFFPGIFDKLFRVTDFQPALAALHNISLDYGTVNVSCAEIWQLGLNKIQNLRRDLFERKGFAMC